MNAKKSKSSNDEKSKAGVVAAILTSSVLAYCGYKIVKNKLEKTEYEPDPNKDV